MKGYVYQIICGNETYVGSTRNFMDRRLKHSYNIRKGKARLYQAMRENDNKWFMSIVSIKEYETDKELRVEEDRIRVQLKATLNMIKCG
tara:strand:- start:1154 stop:1420 length:267 start_codon:yes stop_codon:yes gene_type:complete